MQQSPKPIVNIASAIAKDPNGSDVNSTPAEGKGDTSTINTDPTTTQTTPTQNPTAPTTQNPTAPTTQAGPAPEQPLTDVTDTTGKGLSTTGKGVPVLDAGKAALSNPATAIPLALGGLTLIGAGVFFLRRRLARQ